MTYTFTARLADDQAAAIKAYAKDHGGITNADAIRILIALGLQYGKVGELLKEEKP